MTEAEWPRRKSQFNSLSYALSGTDYGIIIIIFYFLKPLSRIFIGAEGHNGDVDWKAGILMGRHNVCCFSRAPIVFLPWIVVERRLLLYFLRVG